MVRNSLLDSFRSVFFSFDYDDVLKAMNIRNSNQFTGVKKSGFRDKAEFEQVKRSGDQAIKNWIRRQMSGCSVTVVLIGDNTYQSDWVNFEIKESIDTKMGLVGIYLHEFRFGLLDNSSYTQPINPLYMHTMPTTLASIANGREQSAGERYNSYTWKPAPKNALMAAFNQNRLGDWVEEAYQISQRPFG